jgi:hypothetical protein
MNFFLLRAKISWGIAGVKLGSIAARLRKGLMDMGNFWLSHGGGLREDCSRQLTVIGIGCQ